MTRAEIEKYLEVHDNCVATEDDMRVVTREDMCGGKYLLHDRRTDGLRLTNSINEVLSFLGV